MESGIIIQPVTPLFAEPDVRSERVDELLYGMVCAITETTADGEWVRCATRYGYAGWLHGQGLLRNASLARIWEVQAEHQVRMPFTDLLAEPRDGAQVLLTLPRGAEVRLLPEQDGRWTKVSMPDGGCGWALTASFQSPADVSAPGTVAWRERVVRSAMGYLGTQYRWGGKSPLGIDCSGLAQMAYGLNGVRIPRDADEQQAAFRAIDPAQALAGDLLFSPGHVMVCLGDGMYVHATGREGFVLVNSLEPGHPAYREDIALKLSGAGTLPEASM